MLSSIAFFYIYILTTFPIPPLSPFFAGYTCWIGVFKVFLLMQLAIN